MFSKKSNELCLSLDWNTYNKLLLTCWWPHEYDLSGGIERPYQHTFKSYITKLFTSGLKIVQSIFEKETYTPKSFALFQSNYL